MLDLLKQSGAAWRTLRLCESFTNSLDDAQKSQISEIKTSLRGIGEGVLPDEVKPVIDYVLADNGEPTVAKVIGAAMHPTVKSSLAGILSEFVGSEQLTEAPGDGSPITVACRKCGYVAQYGATEPADITE